MADSTKRVMILVSDAGFGHRNAAKAITAALAERYGDAVITETVNPLDDKRVPALLRNSQYDYDRFVRTMPKLYDLGYEVSDSTVSTAVMDGALTLMLFEVLRDLIRRAQPDVLVVAYPVYQAPLSAIRQLARRDIPVVTVVTDLVNVHRIWFSEVADFCVVPTEAAREQALKQGLRPERVEVAGVPVSPAFGRREDTPANLRARLGWRTDLKTFLVVGSKRVGNMREVLHVLNHSALPIQLIVIAGGDDELYAELQSTTWHVEVRLYNFVDNLPTMMQASDGVISKAGGLIVSESLACGLPLLLIDALPGQETGNAAYVQAAGAGELVRSPSAALEAVYHWLVKDAALLAERAANARELGRPEAAYHVAERVWALAERVRPSRGLGRFLSRGQWSRRREVRDGTQNESEPELGWEDR